MPNTTFPTVVLNDKRPMCPLVSSTFAPPFLLSEDVNGSYRQRGCLGHRRQPHRGRIPTNILVGGDINRNVPTNIRGGNVVEYEFLIDSAKRKQR